tara:strand:- start:291 stop:470 length:180 start_codon:yes stop_codon:yes gene_type:complete
MYYLSRSYLKGEITHSYPQSYLNMGKMSINIKIILKKDKSSPYEKNISGEKWVVLDGYY